MMKRCLIALSLAGGLCASVAVRAQSPAPPPPTQGNPGNPANRYQSLGLSPDQMKRVQDLHRQSMTRLRQLERSLRDKRRSLEAVYKEYTLDMDQARRINRDINEIQRDILAQHLSLQVELRKILTADQFARLRQNLSSRRPRPLPDRS